MLMVMELLIYRTIAHLPRTLTNRTVMMTAVTNEEMLVITVLEGTTLDRRTLTETA